MMRQALQSTGSREYPYDWEAGGPCAHVLL